MTETGHVYHRILALADGTLDKLLIELNAKPEIQLQHVRRLSEVPPWVEEGNWPRVVIADHAHPESILLSRMIPQTGTGMIVVSIKDDRRLRDLYRVPNVIIVTGKTKVEGRVFGELERMLGTCLRLAPRYKFSNLVYFSANGKQWTAWGVNLSTTGVLARVQGSDGPAIGQACTVRFTLANDRSYELAATVVRRLLEGNELLVGAHFEAPDEALVTAIEAELAALVSREAARAEVQSRKAPAPKPFTDRGSARDSKVAAGLKVRLSELGSKVQNYYGVRDISSLGALVYPRGAALDPLRVGTKVELLLLGRDGSMRCVGEVVRHGGGAEGLEHPQAMGISFTMNDPDRAALEAFLTRQRKGQADKP
ncbi:MAG: PilZ domain-containing protein [Deltaproteobacteria bacterium]|nr:PilZ domain-containing protein [Deltaproteobacteria bacterium]